MAVIAGAMERDLTLAAPMPGPRAVAATAGSVAWPVAALLLVAVGSWWLIGWAAPGELIRPVSPDLQAGAIFVGVFAGLLLAAGVVARAAVAGPPRQGSRFDALAGALVLPTMAACLLLRLGVQVAAFAGLAPAAVPVVFTLVSPHLNRGGPTLILRYGDAGREFEIPVARRVYDAAAPGEVVTLPVETGRFGIQRAMVATRLTVADLHRPA